ncbi:MAG: hypothetical protein ACTHL1_02105 [Burkholderiaceae bacterium]
MKIALRDDPATARNSVAICGPAAIGRAKKKPDIVRLFLCG